MKCLSELQWKTSQTAESQTYNISAKSAKLRGEWINFIGKASNLEVKLEVCVCVFAATISIRLPLEIVKHQKSII